VPNDDDDDDDYHCSGINRKIVFHYDVEFWPLYMYTNSLLVYCTNKSPRDM
jgi:hypothetical protein